MEVVLDENGMLDYIKTNVVNPPTSDTQDLVQWKKDVAKARRIILNGVYFPWIFKTI